MSLSSRKIESLRDPSHHINFRIISCTSSQNGYQASQLQLQSPQSKGWQSQRFCSYPQFIIIELIDLAIIQKLTFLSHQSKITTKVDIESKESASQQWKRLGYTSMQSNMTTNYEARELRTVKLNREKVKQFRFTLHPNYINTVNVFNQVALIAVSVYGERYHPKPQVQIRSNGVLPPGAILDKETLDKLRELEYMKRQAIDYNDFDKASELKQQIEKLKGGVEALSILEKRKKDAIKREDYEQAKKIYEKMKKIRGPIPRVVASSNDRYDDINRSIQYERNNQTFTPVLQNANKKNKSMSFDADGKPVRNKGVQSPILQLKKGSNLPQVNRSKIINFDEMKVGPTGGKNIFDDEAHLVQQSPRLPAKTSTKTVAKPKFTRNRMQLSREHQQGQLQEKTSMPLLSDCQQYFTIIPQLTFKNLFSGDKNLRQHALQEVLALVDKIEQEDSQEKLFINAVIFIVKHTIDDKIVSIVMKAIDLLGMMFKEYKPKTEEIQRENIGYLKEILEKLSDHLGSANDKLKSQAQDVYIVLPKYSKSTSKQLCIQTITLNQKIDKFPRIIISKLQMLGKLIRKYDQQNLKTNKSTIGDKKKEKYEDVIQYSKRFLEDRNSEVRATAVKLLVYLEKVIGTEELMQALSDVKEATLRVVEDKIVGKELIKERKMQPRVSPKNDSPKISKNNSPKNEHPPKLSPRKAPKTQKKVPSPTIHKKQPTTHQPPPKKPISTLRMPFHTELPTQQPPQPPQQPLNPEYICQYCQTFDKRLENQNFRDVHWFKYCPMITICKECQQAVQVECINQHLLQQCEKKKYYKKCPKCKEAVLAKDYNQHVQKKGCITAKPLNVANRCPHCHEDIEPKKKGLLKHLVTEGCPCQEDRAKQQDQ